MLSALLATLPVLAFALAIGLLWHLEGRGRWRRLLTERFLYGVPWGTLVVVGFVLAVYLGLQGGARHWHDPLVVPFRSWSYLYPTGTLVAGFAHSSPGHLVSNLLGTLVLAPIAEYAWGHYAPTRSDDAVDEERDEERGEERDESDLDEDGDGDVDTDGASDGDAPAVASRDLWDRTRAWRRTPWIRAFVLFPAAVLVLGVFTSVFFLGPVIGFSGVVFALGGFALVYYPITTLVALFVASVANTTYDALRDPIVVGRISGSAPSLPWWAEVAIQAHWLGILVGIVLGLALLQHRDRHPNAARVFLAVLIYGFTRNLWAVFWIGDEGTYTLYRGVGVAVVVGFAVVVALAAGAGLRDRGTSGRSVAGEGDEASSPQSGGVFDALSADDGHVTLGLEPQTRQVAALVFLVCCAAALSGIAIIPNLVTPDEDPVPGAGEVTVEDYALTYEEDVRNRLVPVVPLPVVENQTRVRTSGVIVVSEERHVWLSALSRQYLASEGHGTVTVGGVGWRETVHAERSGWQVAGNASAYVVDLRVGDGEPVRSFVSGPSRAEHRVANHTVAVVPTDDEFELRVRRDGERVAQPAVPAANGTTTVGNLLLETIEEHGRVQLYAESDGTRVRIAQRERYRNR